MNAALPAVYEPRTYMDTSLPSRVGEESGWRRTTNRRERGLRPCSPTTIRERASAEIQDSMRGKDGPGRSRTSARSFEGCRSVH